MAQPFPLVQTTDRNVNQLQQNITGAIGPIQQALQNSPITSGKVYKATFSDGQATVNHSLGKVPTGWIVTDVSKSLTGPIYRNDWNANNLVLSTTDTSTFTINVMVF